MSHVEQGSGGGHGWKPHPSRVLSEGGVVFGQGRGGVGRETLPSCVSGKGGVDGGGKPSRLAFRAREGWWWEETPSVLRFRQGRGGGGLETLP